MRGGDCRNFQRSHRRAGIFGGGAGNFAKEEKSAAAANREMPAVGATVGRAQRGGGFLFAAAAGYENHDGSGVENCHEAAAGAGGVEGDAVRLARGETPEIKRDFLRPGGAGAR